MTIDYSKVTTKEEMQAILRNDLSAFTMRVFRTLQPKQELKWSWHNDLICEYLTACFNRDIKRLIINVPPRSLKSITTSVAFPAWVLGKNPSEKILTSSYGHSLSTKHSRETRTIVQSDWYRELFPNVILSHDVNTQSEFETTEKGARLSTSVGGGVTGQGGDILIVDDPHNVVDALSATKRQTALDWFDTSFTSRENDPENSVYIIIQQRVHEGDLTGHLLTKEDEYDDWHHLCIPMEMEEDTTYHYPISGKIKEKKEGDLLNPERWSEKKVRKLKVDLGSLAYAGQYQQRPAPAEGNIFKKIWFGEYFVKPESGTVYQSWDTAYKEQQVNDPSVCTTWLEYEKNYYLLDVFEERMDYPKLKRAVIQKATEYKADIVLIEDKASGQSLIQELKRDTNIPIKPIMPDANKLTRASQSTSIVEAGRVFLPDKIGWKQKYLSQLLTFPNATHDDMVDSTSQFLNHIKYNSGGGSGAEIW